MSIIVLTINWYQNILIVRLTCSVWYKKNVIVILFFQGWHVVYGFNYKLVPRDGKWHWGSYQGNHCILPYDMFYDQINWSIFFKFEKLLSIVLHIFICKKTIHNSYFRKFVSLNFESFNTKPLKNKRLYNFWW